MTFGNIADPLQEGPRYPPVPGEPSPVVTLCNNQIADLFRIFPTQAPAYSPAIRVRTDQTIQTCQQRSILDQLRVAWWFGSGWPEGSAVQVERRRFLAAGIADRAPTRPVAESSRDIAAFPQFNLLAAGRIRVPVLAEKFPQQY